MSGLIDKPLLRSGVSDRIWKMLEVDPDRFKEEVREYFALTMPGWSVVKVTQSTKTVWLKDERVK